MLTNFAVWLVEAFTELLAKLGFSAEEIPRNESKRSVVANNDNASFGKCNWVYIPMSAEEMFLSCDKDATHTSCDYGNVCEMHRCRCSKPLK